MSTVRETFGNRGPNVWLPEKKIIPRFGASPDLLYGVELEIEGLDQDEALRTRRCVGGMEYHRDGSLRNNGGEFVTYPMTLNYLDYVLDQFFQKNRFGPQHYSERCSVHVHANCLDMQLEEVRLLLCIYQILEKVLFSYIGQERETNIFCVPWGESYLPHAGLKDDSNLIGKIKTWKKYTSLNLAPLASLGTIEFRHMAGTNDKEMIIQWCDIIGSLFKYAREHKFEQIKATLLELNTTSAYRAFMEAVFEPHLVYTLCVGGYRDLLEEGALNMKLALLDRGTPKMQEGRNPPRRPQAPFVPAAARQENRRDFQNLAFGLEPFGNARQGAARDLIFDDLPVQDALDVAVDALDPADDAEPFEPDEQQELNRFIPPHGVEVWPEVHLETRTPERWYDRERQLEDYNPGRVWLNPLPAIDNLGIINPAVRLQIQGENARWGRAWEQITMHDNAPLPAPPAQVFRMAYNFVAAHHIGVRNQSSLVWGAEGQRATFFLYSGHAWSYNITRGQLTVLA